MSLFNFFRISMPYGIKRNSANEWFAFNREYMPLGWNSTQHKKSIQDDTAYAEYPIHTKYSGVTELRLMKLGTSENYIQRDEKGEIHTLFLYDDNTNPSLNAEGWDMYLEKIKLLSMFEV